MPRRPRVVVEGGLYHVCNRVASGERVLEVGEEVAWFEQLIRQVKVRISARPAVSESEAESEADTDTDTEIWSRGRRLPVRT